jgi:hypothetical protein
VRFGRTHIAGFNILFFVASFFVSCAKEYSRESADAIIPPVIDTLPQGPPQQGPPTAINFYSCVACAGHDIFEENKWSFKVGNSLQCGTMDTALSTPERNAFTFFGPSSCSSDTSMVITVFLQNNVLDKNLQGLAIPNVDFRYTKFGAPKYLLLSRQPSPFTLTIDSYDHQTKMTIGRFYGYAYAGDGSLIEVQEGKFKVKIH